MDICGDKLTWPEQLGAVCQLQQGHTGAHWQRQSGPDLVIFWEDDDGILWLDVTRYG